MQDLVSERILAVLIGLGEVHARLVAWLVQVLEVKASLKLQHTIAKGRLSTEY